MYPVDAPSQARTAADPEPEPIALAAPPRLTESPPMAGSAGMILVPAASGLGAVLLAVTHQDRPLYAVAGLAVLAASIAAGLGMVASTRTGARRRTREQRERYLDHLEQARVRARAAATRQGDSAARRHPDPRVAASMAWLPARRWARGRSDPDFLVLRAGLGPVPLASAPTLRVDDSDPLAGYDQVCLTAAEELAARYTSLAEQPICVPLAAATALAVVGEPARVVSVTRALLAQLIWAHSPADVAVLACGGRSETWDWLKWLPHTLADQDRDGPLPMRMITDGPEPATDLLTAQARWGAPAGGNPGRRTVVVIDGLSGWTGALSALAVAAKGVGAVALCLIPTGLTPTHLPPTGEPAGMNVRLLLGDTADCIESASGALRCRLDELDAAGALLLARSFAGLPAALPRRHPVEPSAIDPLGVGDAAALDPAVSWRPRSDGDLLRVPIGTAQDGTPLVLDLKESARGGMGPHGLVVGATGSGKSELLRSLVTALAIAHPPETLALLLADFKGGATFSGLAELPHVAGTITNLETDLSLVDRFRDALGGELQRRQELLAASGKLTSLHAYADLRRRRPELEPMPHLLVVVDEFSELLGARPDLAELFVTIGRIGRSIGIHLLLATQRLDIGRIRGLESHLSYRICLRTFSEAESREAIGSPDAYHLPPEPGSAFLRADNAGLRRFRSATMSIPCRSPTAAPEPGHPLVLPFGPGLAERIWELRRRSQAANGSDESEWRDRSHRDPTMLDVAIQRIRLGGRELPAGRPARRVWLDPLPARLWLADLLGRSDCQPVPGRATAVLGVVDNPERQRQDALRWDFTEGNGNLLIVGAGRSGKTTAVRTLLLSLAARHPPSEVQLVCVDLAGETLRPFGALPQVAAVATRDDDELTLRVFSRLTDLLAEREAPGGRHRLGSAATRIVLIIDGWVGGGDSDAMLDEILRRGPAVGLHTVLTVNAPSGLRARLAAGFSGRIELRLADSFDSSIDRQMAKALPVKIPGRALVAGRHYAQVALPDLRPGAVRAGGSARATQHGASGDDGDATGHAVATIRSRWPGPAAPLIRTLPSMVRLEELRAAARGRRRPAPGLLLGIAEDDLGPVRHDLLGDDPHLLIYGDARAGKTMVLRSLLAQLSVAPDRGVPPDRVLIVDYRGGLTADAVSGGHRIAVGTAESGAICTALVAELTGRMRPAGGRLDSVGPRIYLLVDDYELFSSGAGNPLSALIPLLPHARDLRFHLILTRRTGGAARAQYEPLLQTLGDLGTPMLLLSGSSAEGRLAHGLTPRPLPPGRALIATRETAPQVIQTPWVP